MPRADWSGYLEAPEGWYKPGEVDQHGHQIYYGWDAGRSAWFVKTHRGGRGKRKSEQTSELLALREEIKAKDSQIARIREETEKKEKEHRETEDRLRSSKEAAEHLAEKEKRKSAELQSQLETESSELLDRRQEYWNLEEKYKELLKESEPPAPSSSSTSRHTVTVRPTTRNFPVFKVAHNLEFLHKIGFFYHIY